MLIYGRVGFAVACIEFSGCAEMVGAGIGVMATVDAVSAASEAACSDGGSVFAGSETGSLEIACIEVSSPEGWIVISSSSEESVFGCRGCCGCRLVSSSFSIMRNVLSAMLYLVIGWL
jgi:hypothetical protein